MIKNSITLGQLFKFIGDAYNYNVDESNGYTSLKQHILKLNDFATRGGIVDHLAFRLHPFHPCLHRSLIQREEASKAIALMQEQARQ